MGIRLLDCTLRDGGHINNSRFGENRIFEIIHGLEESKVDILEVGFCRDFDFGRDYAATDEILDFENRFGLSDNNIEYCVMIQEDQYDVSKLPKCSGKIKRIRVSFHDYDMEDGFAFCEEVIRKGYICHVNPINTTGYSDAELLFMINRANDIGADVFTIVDTFGAMTQSDMTRIFTLVHHNLKSDMAIGIHLHDNLQLAYALAQQLINMAPDDREIIIDASLLGMGRTPGNLCMELIMDYMNREKSKAYNVDAALDVIDNAIRILKQENPWGYETAYSLSAQYKIHRSYAEYLIKKQKLKTKQIRQILGKVEKSKSSRYDEKYISLLYEEYISVDMDDGVFLRSLKKEIAEKDILLIAPGASLNQNRDEITEYVKMYDPIIFTANFSCDFIDEDYIFCSNIKRYDKIKLQGKAEKCILTSNLRLVNDNESRMININKYAWFGDLFWDNCMLILLHLLQSLGVHSCHAAGWDGFGRKNDFISDDMECGFRYEDENIKVKNILKKYLKGIEINFLTPSKYQE